MVIVQIKKTQKARDVYNPTADKTEIEKIKKRDSTTFFSFIPDRPTIGIYGLIHTGR